jgi:hypothetical protein
MDVIQKIICIHLKYRRHGNRIDGVIVSVLTSRAVDRGFGGIIRPLVSASALTWFIRYISYPNLQFTPSMRLPCLRYFKCMYIIF